MKYILIAAVLATLAMGIQMTTQSQLKMTTKSQDEVEDEVEDVEGPISNKSLKQFKKKLQNGGMNMFEKFKRNHRREQPFLGLVEFHPKPECVEIVGTEPVTLTGLPVLPEIPVCEDEVTVVTEVTEVCDDQIIVPECPEPILPEILPCVIDTES